MTSSMSCSTKNTVIPESLMRPDLLHQMRAFRRVHAGSGLIQKQQSRF